MKTENNKTNTKYYSQKWFSEKKYKVIKTTSRI